MHNEQTMANKANEVINSIGTSNYMKLAVEFLEMVESCEFKKMFREDKASTIGDARNLLGFHNYHPDEKTTKEVKKEVQVLLNCIEFEH